MQGTIRTPSDLAPFIDHTLLKPEVTEREIEYLCAEALAHGFKAVCVNPVFVRRTRQILDTSPVQTAAVIGFPLGTHDARVKALEAEFAIRDGATEIDMTARLDLIKTAAWLLVERDIAEVVRAAGDGRVKVILETGLLTRAEIVGACRASEAAGAAFVKTSTGFLSRGASLDDIKVMRASCSEKVEIKASGGIKSFEQAKNLIAAGAGRLGTSSGVFLVTGKDSPGSGY